MPDAFVNTLTGAALGSPTTTEKQTYQKHIVIPAGEDMTLSFSAGVLDQSGAASNAAGTSEVFNPGVGEETTLVVTIRAVKRA